MLAQFTATLGQFAHMAGILLILYGAFLVAGAMLSNGAPLTFLRGFAFAAAGTWLSGIVG